METIPASRPSPTRITTADLGAIAICLLAAAVIYAPILLSDRVISNIDFRTHYRWLSQFSAALAEGTLYPRWMPLSNLGLGELHYSAYPLYYYTASLLVLTGIEPWMAMKCLAAISAWLSGLIAYLGLRRFISRRIALIGAILFQATPLFLFLFSHHAAIPWHFSIPLAAMLLLLAVPPGKQTNPPALALTVSALMLTHVLVAFMLLLCLGLVWLFHLIRSSVTLRAFILDWNVPVALGIGLVAFHLVPAIAARALVDPASSTDPVYLNWRNSFVFPTITAAVWVPDGSPYRQLFPLSPYLHWPPAWQPCG